MSQSPQQLSINGLDGASGEYLLPSLSTEAVAQVARGQRLDPAHLRELRWRRHQLGEAHYGLVAGVDPRNLAETGWGVIFPQDASPALREALQPLLEHRRRLATARSAQRYQEYSGSRGYRPNETKTDFLARLGAGPGAVDPDKVPYYLLLVGSPEQLPFNFQYPLDVQYAVGRLDLETPEEYARYARAVVEAETTRAPRPRRATFFGVRNPEDPATELSATQLVQPLAQRLAGEHPDWEVRTALAGEATKARLARLLGGDETPALLFTASHGLGFPNGHPLQRSRQGALVCQDWPGPRQHRGALPDSFYFSEADVGPQSQVAGLLSFHFACYGAGTPQQDDFYRLASAAPAPIAPHPFIARLPQRLLAQGALAVVGHVERAWGCSFLWGDGSPQLGTFMSTLKQLLQGLPVGAAMEFFNSRYGELCADLDSLQDSLELGKQVAPFTLAALWTARNDARNMILLGDPAVRLAVG
jgi:hypothetical protein